MMPNSMNKGATADSRRKKQKTFSLSAFHAQLEEHSRKLRESKERKNAWKQKVSNSLVNGATKDVTSAERPEIRILARPALPAESANSLPASSLCGRGRSRGRGCARSCPRMPSPLRCVPPELRTVDRMTSADFRHDFGAHLENMRLRQQDQQHLHFFQVAIEENRHLFAGRSILVLNCGTGTLALMAARAGARRVFALDRSQVSDYAELVVKHNNYGHIISVLHGRVADLELPPVDGIVCSWMGHCLLYESELVQLLEARDRWLRPGGFLLPDLGALYLLGGAEQQLKNDRCNWWLDVYGFNMSAMRRYALAEPRHVKIGGDRLLTLAHKVLSVDLRTVGLEELHIDREIRLRVQQEGYLECFVLYFDVGFSRAHRPLVLSCNPCLRGALNSLWHQTLLFVEQPFVMRRCHSYTGRLVFRDLLQPPSLQQMRISIEFFERNKDGLQCRPLVLKSWLLLSRFQSALEVATCQDRQNSDS